MLWLAPGNAKACANLRLEAGRRGIDADRLVFAPRVPPADHLARHVHADLFLDTAPYNAGTTANDALFMGLPVLTCMGTTMAGRVAASQLHAIGLSDLATPDLARVRSRCPEDRARPRDGGGASRAARTQSAHAPAVRHGAFHTRSRSGSCCV